MNYYTINMETQKLELHFEKEDYQALPQELKQMIKSNFLFSGKQGAWVSRAKFPNLYSAEAVAKKLGLENRGKSGEMLSFEEQMERKAEKAEARAERYDAKSESAMQRGQALQKPIHDMHGDIAFFTQPNVNTSSGRAFTRRREKMFSAWERGFDAFKKSEYYEECARTARQTATNTKPTDKGFIDRRIKDAEKTIRAQKQNLESYHAKLEKLNAGEKVLTWTNKELTVAEVERWIEDAELIIEQAISKFVYYHECLEELGGVSFSKENILPGYVVKLKHWGECKVEGTGPVNITYRILHGGAAGFSGKAAYAEILEIVSSEVNIDAHPFKKDEEFTVPVWNGNAYVDKTFRITKVTADKVTLKAGEERAITRKPRKFRNGTSYSWALGIVDGLRGTIYRNEEQAM